MTIRVALMAFIVSASLLVTPPAWAYSEVSTTSPNPSISPSDCTSCHSDASVEATSAGIGEAREGPHSGYTATTRSCAACHIVHGAPTDGYLLLPGATMTETCELCHDGTGGQGVYGAIEARGLTVQAAHRTEATTIVPGGNESTGGTATVVFSGAGGTLSCGDCHQPHGVDLVEPFTTDRRRNASDTAGFFSSELLRRRPGGTTTETAQYGSDWCVACHKGRATGLHNVTNHTVDSSAATGSDSFYYENVQVVKGVDSTQTAVGSLGGSNFGYVMPWPRTAGQEGHWPICQQCHEDARSVGDSLNGSIVASETFSITSPDGTNATDNPRFQVFPHESAEPSLLIETGDDLCTNCHHSGQME